MATTRRSGKRIVLWTIISLVAVCIIVVAGLLLFSGSIVGPAPAPLQLPPLSPATTRASTASPDGTWSVGGGLSPVFASRNHS